MLIALLVVAVALITIDFRDGGTSNAHSIGGRLFGPVERVGGDVTGWFRGGSGGELVAGRICGVDANQRLEPAESIIFNLGDRGGRNIRGFRRR